jgi:CRP-like cAMP-binding protein
MDALFRKISVLIIDPGIESNHHLIDRFKKTGVREVHGVCDLDKVPNKAKELIPRVVVVSGQFPTLSRLDVYRQIKIIPHLTTTPVLFCGANMPPEEIRQLVNEGIAGFIESPATEEQITRGLRTYFRKETVKKVYPLIRACEFFKAFNDEEIKQLTMVTIPRRYSAGDTIINKGDPGDTLYILLQGRVEVLLVGKNRRGVTIPILVGNPFGDMSILNNEPCSACILAANEVIVLEIGAQILKDKGLPLGQKIFAKLAEILAFRLRNTNAMLEEIFEMTLQDQQQKLKHFEEVKASAKNKSLEGQQPIKEASNPSHSTPPEELKKKIEQVGPTDPTSQQEGQFSLESELRDDPTPSEPNSDEEEQSSRFLEPTAIAISLDESISSDDEYDVMITKLKLRTEFISSKIPADFGANLRNKLFGYLLGSKLAKFNPHQRFNPKWFTPGSTRLKQSLHLIVCDDNGFDAYEQAYMGLPFSHKVVSGQNVGCSGTFLGSRTSIERFTCAQSLEIANKWDLEMPIDRMGSKGGTSIIEYLTHTMDDVRKETIFLVFDTLDGEITWMIREAFPMAQIITVVKDYEYDPKNTNMNFFTCVEDYLQKGGKLVKKEAFMEKGFYQGETLLLPSLAKYFYEYDSIATAGYLFGFMGQIAKFGPNYEGEIWGSSGGAEGAMRAARAMFGMKGAQSAADLNSAVQWADG